jgi:hypothetical protein
MPKTTGDKGIMSTLVTLLSKYRRVAAAPEAVMGLEEEVSQGMKAQERSASNVKFDPAQLA